MKVLILVDLDMVHIDQHTFKELTLVTVGDAVFETKEFQIMVLD